LISQLNLNEPPELISLYPNSPADPTQVEQHLGNTTNLHPSSQGRAAFNSSSCYFIGGETEALKRLQQYLSVPEQVIQFEKPNTSPNSLVPSTTTLSPYLKFGCISPRTVWHGINQILQGNPKLKPSTPPVSLHGQLYWREFFYLSSACVPNFDRMQDNPICKQIDYSYAENDVDRERLEAWKHGRTGFPWIDACMIQLRQHGWIHHLGRHAVACFLTRGDLYLHWELGRDVFDELLLDSDWALNNANWMWLSASAFFHQYHRVYSPVSFGKKTDPSGKFIRHFIPVLAKFPDKYIYEPWLAPESVQKKAGCVIGVDYPMPIVDHAVVSKQNMARMKLAYGNSSTLVVGTKRSRLEHQDDAPPTKKSKS
jgi:cryptochrome